VYDWDLLEGMAIGMLMMKSFWLVLATDFHSTTVSCCLKALRGFFPFFTLSEKKEVKMILFTR